MSDFTVEQVVEILGLKSIPNAHFSSLIIRQLQLGLNTGKINAVAVMDVIRYHKKSSGAVGEGWINLLARDVSWQRRARNLI